MNKSLLYRIGFPLFITALLLLFTCRKDNHDDFADLDLLEKLNHLEGVSAVEITPSYNYSREFQLDIVQPVDHDNPGGQVFTQRAYLSHTDENMPMVFAPNGYGTNPASNQEIAAVLQTNCLAVTHRYFINAKPDPVNWQYLTIKQAAADHHHIVQLMKKIYKGKWISSGASKGGLTVLFHKRYYPDDVDATIAYVAPFTFGPGDERFPAYLAQLGEPGCYDKLKAVQVYVLKHRKEMLEFLDNYITESQVSYSLNRDLLLELNIMDYPFSFWQYFNLNCSSVPDTTDCTPQEIFDHYTLIVPPSNFSDGNISYFEPYVYQTMTEMGAPAYETGYLLPYLEQLDVNSSVNPNYTLLGPQGVSYTFNESTLQDIYEWLQIHADRTVFIYGKNDPWSAGAIELGNPSPDVVFIMQEGANHRVKIDSLDNPGIVYSALERWLEISITAPGKKALPVCEEIPGSRLNPFDSQE